MTRSIPDADRQSTDARTRLIEVAAKHFAADGFKGASQRAIQRDAGSNPAAAHYYFGSKEALYKAVIDTFIHDIQEQRIAFHAALPANLNGRARLQALLQSYFEPSLAITEKPAGLAYARILARNQLERQDVFEMFEDAARPVRDVYLDSLSALFPDSDRDIIKKALLMGVSLMASVSIRQPDAVPVPATQKAEELACFVAAGFEALLGPPDE